MNRVKATITDIESHGNISLVRLDSEGVKFTSVILDTPESSPFIHTGNQVTILFKETEVIVCTGEPGQISLRNRIRGKIKMIEKGQLLSRIITETAVGRIRALITTNAVSDLMLHEGGDIFVMIKTNELMLSE